MRERMRPYWDEATRHEDKFNSGIADVSFICGGNHGWVELKQLDKWPVRPSTIVRCKHYTTQQRHFLKAKGEHGGNTWLFVKIGRDYLLMHHGPAQLFGTMTSFETRFRSFGQWRNRMNWEELADILAAGHR